MCPCGKSTATYGFPGDGYADRSHVIVERANASRMTGNYTLNSLHGYSLSVAGDPRTINV